MPPDTNPPRPLPETGFDPVGDDEDVERLLIQAAVDEALSDPSPDIPHEEVRREMMAMIAEAQERIAEVKRRAKERTADRP